MNIGFDAKRAFHNHRGLGNYTRTLIMGLRRFFPDHHYSLFTPSLGKTFEPPKSPSLDIVLPDSLISQIFSSTWRSFFLGPEINKRKIDIFHGLSNELPFFLQKTMTKKIVTVHDVIFMRFPKFFSLIDRKVYEKKVNFALQAADIVVATSEQTQKDILEFFKIDEKKIRLVYQSCLPIFYEPNHVNKDILKIYAIKKPFILSVGALEPRKNILKLIASFSQIAKQIEDHLIIVGRGSKEYLEQIYALIKEKKLFDRVHVLTDVPTQHLPTLYHEATFFAFPSLFEGFGIPIIEALTCGTPVVTSHGSCCHEVGGEASLYCNPESEDEIAACMLELITNDTLYQKLKKKTQEQAQKFHWLTTTSDMMDIYQKLLSNPHT